MELELIKDTLTLGLAQIAPVWLDQEKTINKIIDYITKSKSRNCELVIFGEALLPGYPFWVELTDGAAFNSPVQKELFSYYMNQAIDIQAGEIGTICECCKINSIAAVVGTIEKAQDRGGHSLYCSLVYINSDGVIESVHRKLMPTYEERLVWSPGDGHGLRVHHLGAFTVGALNCWENWMPLARTALYALGEDLHIAIWPGSKRNTEDITRFIAKESRSYVVSVSGLFGKRDIPDTIPHASLIRQNSPAWLADGGSCVAAPDGTWLLEPQTETEDLFVVTINHDKVRQERQNFDPAGHYSRPDVTQLHVNRKRQNILNIIE